MTTVWMKAPVEGGELLLLLALADNANDDGVAFPSVSYLARKARMTGRNVQLCLRKLESKGLMRVIPNAGMSGTNKYRLELKTIEQFRNVQDSAEDAGGENISPPKTLKSGGEKFSPGGEAHFTGGVKNDAQGGEAHFTLTVIEPSDNLSDAHARVREADDPCPDFGHGSASPDEEQPEDRRMLRRAFQALVNGWPGFQGMSLEGAWKQFQALTPQERQDAARRKDAWIKLLRSQGKDHTPAPSTYFRDRLWEAVPDRIETPASAQQMAAPFGKLWSYHVLKLLKAPPIEPPPPSAFIRQVIEGGGEAARRAIRDRKAAYGWPQVNRILETAMDGRGCAASAAEAAELPEMEAVEKNSRTFDAWRIAFTEAGLPFIRVPDHVQFVWLPKAGPNEWAGKGTGPSPAPTACGPGGPRACASDAV